MVERVWRGCMLVICVDSHCARGFDREWLRGCVDSGGLIKSVLVIEREYDSG